MVDQFVTRTRPRGLTGADRSDAWKGVAGVCFDLGGTLIRPDIHPTTGQVAQLLGIDLAEARTLLQVAKRRRISPAELARDLATQFDRPALAGPLHQVLHTARDRAADPVLYPETMQVLRTLRARRYTLCAMTNSLGSSLPEQGLPPFYEFFDVFCASADTGFCKPERQAFTAVEERTGLKPEQLVHVGNAAGADVAGALAADWHAAYLHRPEETQPIADAPTGAVTIRTLRTLTHLLLARAA